MVKIGVPLTNAALPGTIEHTLHQASLPFLSYEQVEEKSLSNAVKQTAKSCHR